MSFMLTVVKSPLNYHNQIKSKKLGNNEKVKEGGAFKKTPEPHPNQIEKGRT